MNQLEIFYKLLIANIVGKYLDDCRTQLHRELYALADDPILLKRRFRMLSQLADYESQIYKKIYDFSSDSTDDYTDTLTQIKDELYHITQKSG
jgi:hypothetical protein